MLIHVVDELDTLTLILEGWIGEGLPAAVLTLIFVGWPPLRPHWKSYKRRGVSNGYGGDYRISGCRQKPHSDR